MVRRLSLRSIAIACSSTGCYHCCCRRWLFWVLLRLLEMLLQSALRLGGRMIGLRLLGARRGAMSCGKPLLLVLDWQNDDATDEQKREW